MSVRLSPEWLAEQAVRLWEAVDDHYGRASFSDGDGWWRLVVATGGWSENEAAIAAVDPIWNALTLQAAVRGGLHVWAWGPVPEDVGGPLGPVTVGDW